MRRRTTQTLGWGVLVYAGCVVLVVVVAAVYDDGSVRQAGGALVDSARRDTYDHEAGNILHKKGWRAAPALPAIWTAPYEGRFHRREDYERLSFYVTSCTLLAASVPFVILFPILLFAGQLIGSPAEKPPAPRLPD